MFSTWTVKQCSITFVQHMKFVYGILLIQYLHACKSLIFFFILKSIKLSFSLFLDVNQLTIARMYSIMNIHDVHVLIFISYFR